MSNRVTERDLKNAVAQLNRNAGKPLDYGTGPEYAGQFVLAAAYGGWQLQQRTKGTTIKALTSGFLPKRELYERIMREF